MARKTGIPAQPSRVATPAIVSAWLADADVVFQITCPTSGTTFAAVPPPGDDLDNVFRFIDECSACGRTHRLLLPDEALAQGVLAIGDGARRAS